MIKEQDDDYSVIDNIYLYVNNPIEENIYISLKKRGKIGLEECEKKFKDSYWILKWYENVYKNIEEYNLDRECAV